MSQTVSAPVEHLISHENVHRARGDGCRHRARCTCGWGSDSYAAFADAQHAASVHLRRARRADFEELIARSSIGAAIADVKARALTRTWPISSAR